jgi:Transcription factor zinc-finger
VPLCRRAGRHERNTMSEKPDPAARGAKPTAPGRHDPVERGLVCPRCQGAMKTYVRGGLVVDLCEDCRGMFLDQGELERLIDAEGGGWSGIVTDPVDPTS